MSEMKKESTAVKLLGKVGIYPDDFTVKGLLTVVGIFILGLGVFATANMALGQLTVPLANALEWIAVLLVLEVLSPK